MGYLCLAAALFFGQLKGFCGKKISSSITELTDSITANLLRMILCILIGFFAVIISTNSLYSLAAGITPICISLLGGISTAAFVVSWLFCVRRGAYMMVNVFLSLGCAIPLSLTDLFFGESIKLTQWLGLGVLAAAAWFMCAYNNTVKQFRLTPSALLLLILCGCCDGLSSFSQKCFQRLCVHAETRVTALSVDVSVYNFYTYLFAALALAVCLFLIPKGTNRSEKTAFLTKRTVFYVCIMSVCLWLYSYMMVQAAGSLSAAQLYPLSQGLGLVLGAVMAHLFLDEKINSKCVLGMILTFSALMLINL